jgi:predicted  nucleic acid-binding Zn-ribbon protein
MTMTMTMSKSDLASNQLSRGTARDMRHALTLVMQEYQDEIDVIDCFARDLPPHLRDISAALQHARADLTQQIATVEECLREYDTAIEQAGQTLFEQWAASDDADVKRLGEVGISHDYAELAI